MSKKKPLVPLIAVLKVIFFGDAKNSSKRWGGGGRGGLKAEYKFVRVQNSCVE